MELVQQWPVDTSTTNQLLLISTDTSQSLYITRTMDNTGRIDRIDVTNGTVGSTETLIEENGYRFTDMVYDHQQGYGSFTLLSKHS